MLSERPQRLAETEEWEQPGWDGRLYLRNVGTIFVGGQHVNVTQEERCKPRPAFLQEMEPSTSVPIRLRVEGSSKIPALEMGCPNVLAKRHWLIEWWTGKR